LSTALDRNYTFLPVDFGKVQSIPKTRGAQPGVQGRYFLFNRARRVRFAPISYPAAGHPALGRSDFGQKAEIAEKAPQIDSKAI